MAWWRWWPARSCRCYSSSPWSCSMCGTGLRLGYAVRVDSLAHKAKSPRGCDPSGFSRSVDVRVRREVGIQQAMSRFYGCLAFPAQACACCTSSASGDFYGLAYPGDLARLADHSDRGLSGNLPKPHRRAVMPRPGKGGCRPMNAAAVGFCQAHGLLMHTVPGSIRPR